MRRPTRRYLPLVAAFALLFPLAVASTTSAQTATPPADDPTIAQPDAWIVTAFLGPGFGGGLEGSALSLGAALGYNWTTRVGFEGEFGYARQGDTGGLVDVHSNTETFAANALYHIPYGNWLPYATFGIGAMHGNAVLTSNTGVPLSLDAGSTDFSWNIGAGVKRRIGTGVRFRGDVRYFSGGDLASFWRVYGGLSFVLGSR